MKNNEAQSFQITDQVWRISNRHFKSNTYVLINDVNECLLIDPGLDHEFIDQFLIEQRLKPVAILCTHGHFDHIGSSYYFQEKYKTLVHLHHADGKLAKTANFMLMVCKIDMKINIPQFCYLSESTKKIQLKIFGWECTWIHSPGHTPGSCFILINRHLFTGDTLYARGVGLVDSPGEDPSLLKKSLLEAFQILSSINPMVYPGHGDCDDLESIKQKNKSLISFLNGSA